MSGARGRWARVVDAGGRRIGGGLSLAVVAFAGLAGVTACGDDHDSTTAAPSPSASSAALTVRDPWVKAADGGMTAVFGTLVNTGTSSVTVVSASTDVASMMELHETAMVNGAMQMRPKQGGFVIPAGGNHVLQPGGDHLMLMNLTKPVKAGDEVTVALMLSTGQTVPFTAVAKPFTGAQESYAPGAHAPGAPTPGMTMTPSPK